MSEKKLKLKRQIGKYLREHGIDYYSEASYVSACNQVRAGGSWDRKAGHRVPLKTTNGMWLHFPSLNVVERQFPNYTNNRYYLFHFGESLEEVKIALAELTMFKAFNRTELIFVFARGEKP